MHYQSRAIPCSFPTYKYALILQTYTINSDHGYKIGLSLIVALT